MRSIRILSVSLLAFVFTTCSSRENKSPEPVIIPTEIAQKLETAYFASGCFWCTEAVFERVQGVYDVVSGYSGGESKNPSYRDVSRGVTNHAEAVRVEYNPEEVDYATLVEIFFGSHDPTTLNRQGPDIGRQYRSAIFYSSKQEKDTAVKIKERLDKEGAFQNPIVTEITEFDQFWDAEDYHQNYYELNPNQPYILAVSKPKVEKFMKKFKDKLKAQYK